MQQQNKHIFLFLLIVILALALRLPGLTQRPMHTDEAVHAIKFGSLLQDGVYFYDCHEYHGPTLNYFTLIPAWLCSSHSLTEINETVLRIVTVFFGLLTILLLLLIRDSMGKSTLVFSALFAAISPAMVFYSRYYIQETLLVCFTCGALVCGFRYLLDRKLKWLLLTGLFLGLMHATKETAIIAFGAMILAVVLTGLTTRSGRKILSLPIKHILLLLAIALFISALLYSSFLTNISSIVDSYKAYFTYFQRAGHNDIHLHPWHYYFHLLLFYKTGAGPVWSEMLIFVLAIVGFVAAFLQKDLITNSNQFFRLIAFYTLILTVIYSAIPYKTPWNMLSFLHGMILLAGFGTAFLLKFFDQKMKRAAFVFILSLGVLHLMWQAYLANFKFEADPINPYVYAHTSKDIFKITAQINDYAAASSGKDSLYIEVICPGDDYWPLPWYLRSYTHVGWWNHVNLETPAAPIIIISPEVEPDLVYKLYELPPPGKKNLYLPLFDNYAELRSQVEIRGFVVKELWDVYQQGADGNQK